MARYIGKRMLQIIPLVLVLSLLIFFFIHMIPGDPVRQMLPPDATMADIRVMQDALGLNDPLPTQYFNYMKDLLRGDLGTSYRTGLPVTEMLGTRLGPTLQLTLAGMIWSAIFGITLGIVTAINRGKFVDYLGMFVATSAISVPGFWLGLMLIQLFAVKLGWLPSGGIATWKGFILPGFTLGTGVMGTLARYSRSSMMETMQMDYVRTARAKGQSEPIVMVRHAFRNSLVQVVTILGLQLGSLLAGTVITESVFTINGIGRLMVESISFRDYKVVQALLLLFSIQFIFINLVVDILYGALNPKIRYD